MPALDVVERRLLRLAVHGQHDALAAGDHRGGAVQVDAGLHGRPVLAALPGDRQADGVDAEMAVRREQPVRPRPPLGGVVVEADEQLPRKRADGWPAACATSTHAHAINAPQTAALPKNAGLSHLARAASQAGTVQLSSRTSSAASGRRNGVAM